MSYFSDKSAEEDSRRNDAFKFLIAMREALSMAKRSPQPVPYKRTRDLLYDFSPELHAEISELITKRNPSDLVKYYTQKAELLSSEKGEIIFPEVLIEDDLKAEQKLLEFGDNVTLIKRRIFELQSALEHFQPEDISENFILNHDFSLVSRHRFFEKGLYNNAKVKDYKLPGNRILRLRLLHPDKAERIIGSDLVYEQFDLKTEKVRFIHLQYKTWNSNVLYFSQGNVIDQIDKLNDNICASGYCINGEGEKHSSLNYRFPYCSAFLRPTSYLTKPDSTLVSTGVHIPICMVKRIKENSPKIDMTNTKGRSIGNKNFEDLFVDNHLGSRWISFDQLENFYNEKGINSETGRIRVHAQEIIIQSDEEKNNSR